MADDSDDHNAPPPSPNDHFSKLVEAVAQAMARGPALPEIIPPRDPRNFTGTGVDALVFSRVKEEILRDITHAVRERLDQEMERFRTDLRRECIDIVRDATRAFLPDVEIERRIEQKFDDIGLPVDREHKQETSESVRSWRRWQKRIDKVLGGMALALATSVLYALAKMAGINLPLPGNEH